MGDVFRLHGLPTDIVSDRGPQFISQFWQEFCSLLGASASLSSGYHPQPNGQSERLNQELENRLLCLVSQTPWHWSNQLSRDEFTHSQLFALFFWFISLSLCVWISSTYVCSPGAGGWSSVSNGFNKKMSQDMDQSQTTSPENIKCLWKICQCTKGLSYNNFCCPWKTYLSDLRVINWLPDLLVQSRFLKLLIQSL